MTFPRRPQFRRKVSFRTSLGRRQPVPWFNALSENQTISVAGVTTRVIMFDHSDFDYGAATPTNGAHFIHKIEFMGGVGFVHESTTAAQVVAPLMTVCYIADADDDTDTGLWSQANNILSNFQILYHNVQVATTREVPAAQVSDNRTFTFPVRFKLKFRKPIMLRVDHECHLGFCFGQSVADTLSEARLWGLARAIVKPAQMGR